MEDIIYCPIKIEELINRIKAGISETITHPPILQGTELLSVEDVCSIFKVTRATISSWTSDKLLQDYRQGRRIYYKRDEVIAALTKIKRYQRVIP